MERELAHWVERLRERAEAEGLSFPPVAFQEVGPEEMAMLAAYGGFPRRYPHWRWGSAYLHYRETYRYGLARIYELVVNTVPVQAYLSWAFERLGTHRDVFAPPVEQLTPAAFKRTLR